MRHEQSEILILNIDTATPSHSVAVTRGGRVLSKTELAPPIDARHPATPSNTLLPDIDATLRAAQVDLKEIDVFAATQGPGSFMGLRAGLATIKAFAVTLEKTAVGVPTLEAIAHAGLCSLKERVEFSELKKHTTFIASMPAGRGEVFAQVFQLDVESFEVENLCEVTPPAYLAPSALISMAKDFTEVVWIECGENARLTELIVEHGKTTPLHRTRIEVKSLAEHVAALAWKMWQRELSSLNATERLRRAEELQALYVRPSDAEIKSSKFQVPSSKFGNVL